MIGVDPGVLREPLVLREVVREPDGQGGHQLIPRDVVPEVIVWAQVKRRPSPVRAKGGQKDGTVTYGVLARAHELLHSGAVLRWGDTDLTITGEPQTDTYGEFVSFEATEEKR